MFVWDAIRCVIGSLLDRKFLGEVIREVRSGIGVLRVLFDFIWLPLASLVLARALDWACALAASTILTADDDVIYEMRRGEVYVALLRSAPVEGYEDSPAIALIKGRLFSVTIPLSVSERAAVELHTHHFPHMPSYEDFQSKSCVIGIIVPYLRYALLVSKNRALWLMLWRVQQCMRAWWERVRETRTMSPLRKVILIIRLLQGCPIFDLLKETGLIAQLLYDETRRVLLVSFRGKFEKVRVRGNPIIEHLRDAEKWRKLKRGRLYLIPCAIEV